MSVDYADKKFWDARYSQGPSHVLGIFDWFPSTSNERDPLLTSLQEMRVNKAGRVLDIGCGNSSLCEKLAEAGYTRIVGVDYSETVTTMMRERERQRTASRDDAASAAAASAGDQTRADGSAGKAHTVCNSNSQMEGAMEGGRRAGAGVIHYHCMDATNLSFSDSSFDAVLDKGLIDSIMSGLDRKMLWQRLQAQKAASASGSGAKGGARQTKDNAAGDDGDDGQQEAGWGSGAAVLREVRRILKPSGVYLVVSYESPQRRLPLLRSLPDWEVTWSHFEAQQDWYLYRCTLAAGPASPM